MSKKKEVREEAYITFLKNKIYSSGLSVREISAKSKGNIGITTLYDITLNRVKPSLKSMVVLAKTLNFSLDEAFDRREVVA